MGRKRAPAANTPSSTAQPSPTVTAHPLASEAKTKAMPPREGSRWLRTCVRIVALGAAIAAAYMAKESTHVLCLTSLTSEPPKAQSQNVGFMAQVLQKSKGQNICKPEGVISDTCTDFNGAETLRHRIWSPLDKMIRTKFFRTLKVDLYKPCEFWRTEGSCFQRDCIVKPLDDHNVPEPWQQQTVDHTNFGPFLGSFPRQRLEHSDKDFAIVNDETYGDGIWVDLIENPERFTGYAGAGANAVWMSIYQHNCFGVAPYLQDTAGGWGSQLVNVDGKSMPFVQPPRRRRELLFFLENMSEEERGVTLPTDVPLEYRIFYRIVSGLHASISTHICSDYLNSTTNEWEPNLGCFISRIGAFPDRLQNIYFNFVLLSRAIQKMEPYLANYDYSTGISKDDRAVKRLMPKMLRAVKNSGFVFDEKELFQDEFGPAMKTEFKDNFRNISRIMDCTGCEKCRLWGKTQTLGIATALKALFSYPDKSFRGSFTTLDFKRNEIVALITTYFQFSYSIKGIEMFRGMYQDFVTDWRASQLD
ncbi:endoplasmic oxidoreductin-1 [Coemansia sp. RSA 1939]|nr:endoplasmic oxidoreductin-1 [Coemansia sp. RSA 1939]